MMNVDCVDQMADRCGDFNAIPAQSADFVKGYQGNDQR